MIKSNLISYSFSDLRLPHDLSCSCQSDAVPGLIFIWYLQSRWPSTANCRSVCLCQETAFRGNVVSDLDPEHMTLKMSSVSHGPGNK